MSMVRKCLARFPGLMKAGRFVRDAVESRKSLNAQKKIDERIQRKRENHEKLNVVFVCHRPQLWGTLHSVYDAICGDGSFNVKIVAIPNKKQLPEIGLDHEIYESEGAEEYWKEYGCLNGYNYETKEWLDLKTLEPDYVFFQQPYNVTRSPLYKSQVVSKYAKICYVNYFAPESFGKQYFDCLPSDFLKNISFDFSQNDIDHRYLTERVAGLHDKLTKVVLTGYPKFDYRKQYAEAVKGMDAEKKKYQILWTPRWTTNEGYCNFFNYKEHFTEYCEQHPDVDFFFRPHPQALRNWSSTGEFSEEDFANLRKIYDAHENMHIDQSKDYFRLLYSSDCTITDISSMVFDYLVAGKPVILCMNESFEEHYANVAEGVYKVTCWEELTEVLTNLKNGIDPKAEARKKVVRENLIISEEPAGQKIMKVLRDM